MKTGGLRRSWSDTIGFGQVVEKAMIEKDPFRHFQMGGLKKMQFAGMFDPSQFRTNEEILPPQEALDSQKRQQEAKSLWGEMNPGMIWENRNGISVDVKIPQVDPNYQVQQEFDKSTQNLLNKGRTFDNNANLNPRKFNPMNIGNAMNYGVGALSEVAGMVDRNMQQDYVSQWQNNPLSGVLPFDDMRSDRVEEGYLTMKGGGLFANYWAKRRRGEAVGTRKPNKSSASAEEWERSARTAKKKLGGTNLKHYKY